MHVERKSKDERDRERVAALELPPGLLERTWDYLQRGDVLVRLGLCLLTRRRAVVRHHGLVDSARLSPQLHAAAQHRGQGRASRRPTRDGTKEASASAARKVSYVYEQDKDLLVQLRAGAAKPGGDRGRRQVAGRA